MDPDPLRVVLVEDDAAYRGALQQVLARTEGVTVVTQFSSGERALDAASRHAASGPVPWDVVLMDVDLPGLDGIETTRALVQDHGLDVMMLTVFEDPRKIVDAICAGASGYVLKRSSANDLKRQLDLYRRGGAVLSGDVARRVLEVLRSHGPGPRPEPSARLTERERDILRGLVNGLTYAGIADDLGISVHTVRTHVRNVYRKLQVNTATAAVRRALRDGLT